MLCIFVYPFVSTFVVSSFAELECYLNMAEWPSFYGATTDKACLFVFFSGQNEAKKV